MNLAEIFTKLPPHVSDELEKHIDAVQITASPSRAQILEAATTAVNRTREELGDLSPEVNEILDQVPDATVGHIIGPLETVPAATTTTTVIQNPAADQTTTITDVKPL